MKIGINVSWMTPGQAGGMEWYVRSLIEHLGIIDQENEYLLIVGPNNHRTFRLPSPRWKKIVYIGYENSPMAYRVLPEAQAPPLRFPLLRKIYRRMKSLGAPWWTKKLSRLIADERIELWFCPLIYALPLDTEVPVVVTIPDLQHEYMPEFFGEHDLAMRRMGYPYSCKAATAIIGISRHVAQDIVSLYGIEAEKVFGIPLALEQSYRRARADIEALAGTARLKFRLDRPFVLYPANGWRHKNHERLVQAMSIVRRTRPDLQLLMTGCEFDVMDRLRPLLHEHQLCESVRHLGYVSKADLTGLYVASELLVFPSLFEGFGLPLLEAMHLDVPVACSSIGSLPEVGGDAVVYFDPHSPADIAHAILRITEDQEMRARLVAASRKQVERFNYDHTARQTLAVFEQIRDGTLAPPKLPAFRPVIPYNWLRDGHSRWYFRATALRQIDIEIIQPTQLHELRDQTIEVLLNDQRVLTAPIEAQQPYHFSIPAPQHADSTFYKLDIIASARASVHGEILSVQVPRITITEQNETTLRLV